MNPDEELRHLLTNAAESGAPPAGGATRIREATRQGSDRRRQQLAPWQTLRSVSAVLAVLTVAGILTAIGFAIAGSHRSDTSAGSSSTASGGSSAGASQPAAAATGGPGSTGSTGSTGSMSSTASPAGTAAGTAPVPKPAARVVQTGQVSLSVKTGQVQVALDRLGTIAVGAGGYLSDTKSTSGDGLPYGSGTLRIPIASFTSVLIQVRRLGHVDSISSQAQDVTGQYVDLGARISALMQTRATYLTIQSRATTVGDALSVQQNIQAVQTQIEQLQGQQKVLADSSDLATLAVSVSQAGATPAPAPKSAGFAKAWHQAVDGFATGLKLLIRIAGPLALIAILLAAVGVVGRFAYRRVRHWLA